MLLSVAQKHFVSPERQEWLKATHQIVCFQIHALEYRRQAIGLTDFVNTCGLESILSQRLISMKHYPPETADSLLPSQEFPAFSGTYQQQAAARLIQSTPSHLIS